MRIPFVPAGLLACSLLSCTYLMRPLPAYYGETQTNSVLAASQSLAGEMKGSPATPDERLTHAFSGLVEAIQAHTTTRDPAQIAIVLISTHRVLERHGIQEDLLPLAQHLYYFVANVPEPSVSLRELADGYLALRIPALRGSRASQAPDIG